MGGKMKTISDIYVDELCIVWRDTRKQIPDM